MSGTATLRFYAELNDFLSPDRRQRDTAYLFVVAPSVKDAIEALGVPHTEVDLVLADGEPVGFDHRLADGARVSVYPVFERLDIGSVTRVRPEPLREVRFAADSHLGTLARYLRLVGFDTTFDRAWDDRHLAEQAARDRRVVLTRDRGLLKRRSVTHGFFVRADDPVEQLLDVVRALHLEHRLAPFSRCMACNGALDDVPKDDVVDRLEARTLEHFDVFRVCRACGRVYWEGSHHRRLVELVERVRLAGQRAGTARS